MKVVSTNYSTLLKLCTVTLLLLLTAKVAKATHVYGADLFYTHVSGNTYTVEMYVYGDCAGAAFSSLPGAPVVEVYNGTSLFTTLSLTVQAPTNGLEVTPVCPSQAGNTKCSNPSNALPGVKRFYYKSTVTLNTTSANWLFRFTGSMTTHSLGRSTQMTNINNSTGNSLMVLEATLNNSSAPNSSPVFTTIPTPFYCINKAAQYNPGTVNTDNDSLVYSLTAGLQPGNTTVPYRTAQGYSATTPLATATNAFTFSTVTGQLNFTPNAIQQSLVVTKVNEYRNGVLVGSAMREMTFVVYNCNNNPPGGLISSNNLGTLDSTSTAIGVCKSAGTLTFSINPSDLDTHSVTMSVTGLPTGASVSISNNNTTAPSATFTWVLSSLATGQYTFYVTYIDNGCPIYSKQTIAYTIDVRPDPRVALSLVSAATCTEKAVFTMNPSVTPSPWKLYVLQSSTILDSFTNVTSTVTDSLMPGSYTIRVRNANNCQWDTSLVLASPPAIVPGVTVTNALCNADSTGGITASASGGNPAFTYALNSGSFVSSGSFSGLPAGSYTVKIKDQNNCVKDTTVTVAQPSKLNIDSLIATRPLCNSDTNGQVKVTASGGVSPYTYAIGSGTYGTTNTFTGLPANTYVLHVKDNNGCTRDSSYQLTEPAPLVPIAYTQQSACDDLNNGKIVLSASGGTPAYTYALGSGSFTTNATYAPLSAGTYVMHIKDQNNCTADTSISIVDSLNVSATVTVTNALCRDSSSGQIVISGTGGATPYTYALNSGLFVSSGTFTNIAAGTYNLHVKDNLGCLYDTSATINQPTRVVPAVSLTSPLCAGDSTGSASLSASGGTPTYTFALNSGSFSSSGTFGSLPAGTYLFKVKDQHDCIIDTTVTVTQPTLLEWTSLSSSNPLCYGGADGAISVSGTGGVTPYSYAIGTGSFTTNNNFNGLSAGNYSLYMQDANGCVIDTNRTLAQPTQIIPTAVITPVTCNGSNTGIAVIGGTGGTPGYTYAKGTGAFGTGNTFSNLPAGSQLFKIKDQNGCVRDTTVSITEPSPLLLDSLITSTLLCYADTNGVIKAYGNGGTPPYMYALDANPFSPANSFNNLQAASYNVHLKDSLGCLFDTVAIITQPTRVVPTITFTSPLCAGDSTGAVSVSATGGTPTYTYALNSGTFSSGSSFSNLPVGTYLFRVKDQHSCIADTTVVITQPSLLEWDNLTASDLSCFNSQDGVIAVFGKGGVMPYTYAIGTGSYTFNNTFNGLPAGSFVLHLQDANGCVIDTSQVLQQPTDIVPSATLTPVACHGDNTGVAVIGGSGGTPGYTYAKGTGAFGSGNTFTNLPAGTQLFKIKDLKGCVKDTTINITEPSALLFDSLIVSNLLCNDDGTGKIKANGSGGTPPYTYAINANPFGTANIFTGLQAATYAVHLKDSLGCLYDSASTITEPQEISPAIAITTPLCFGQSTGVVVISATGGTPAYTYAKGTGSFGTTSSFGSLAAGSHTFHVKDNNGCTEDTTITITEPTALIFNSLTATIPLCFNDQNGQVSIGGTGGTTPYTYAIGTGAFGNGSTFNSLGANTYIFHIKDANGCTEDSVYTLNQPGKLIAQANIKQSDCDNLANGQASVAATGGSPAYTFALGTGSYSTNNTFGSLAAGTYVLHVKDDKGCLADTTVNIIDSLNLNSGLVVTDALCFDSSNGTATINVTGGAMPYRYSLNSGPLSTNNMFNGLHAGNYTIHVTDTIGCEYDTSLSIAQPTHVAATAVVTEPTCNGADDGSLLVSPTGGTPGYVSALNKGLFTTKFLYSNLKAGTYAVTIKDSNGCVLDTNIVLSQSAPLVYTANVTDAACYGDASGSVQINPSGGTPAYTFAYDQQPFTSGSVLSGLKAGQYLVKVRDSKGCTKDSLISINEPDELKLKIIDEVNPTCFGYTNGRVVISGDGGTQQYQYATGSEPFSSRFVYANLPQGQYRFTVRDANNCTKDTVVVLESLPEIIVSDVITDDVSCFGYSDGGIIITAGGGVPPFKYAKGENNATEDNSFAGLPSGIHSFRITDDEGCYLDTTFSIGSPEKLEITMKAVPNNCDKIDNSGYIEAWASGGTSPYRYAWATGEPQGDNRIINLQPGGYRVRVTDNNDCVDSANKFMEYDVCCKVFIPDAFTPNGDGLNDRAIVLSTGEFKLTRFSIYNRFGERVFTTENIEEGWDGVWHGDLQDLATYNYFAVGVCGNDPVTYKGTITLVK